MLSRVGRLLEGAPARWRPLLILAVLAAGMPTSAASGAVPLIDSPGLWTLSKLGYEDVVLRVDKRTLLARRDLVYRLPADAAQGSKMWYAIRFHFRVSVFPNTRSAMFAVSADTNGRTVASIIFRVEQTSTGTRLTSDSLGLVAGQEARTTAGLTQEVDFRNYLQLRGVKPGPNVLTFRVTANALPLVRSVRVFADTGIEVTPFGPARVEINVDAPLRTIRVGERFPVRFELRLAEGRPVDRALFHVSYPRDLLRLHGEADRRLDWRSTLPLTGTVEFTAQAPGAAPVHVEVEAAGQSLAASSSVNVVPSGDAGTTPWFYIVATALGLGALAGLGVIRVRRRRG